MTSTMTDPAEDAHMKRVKAGNIVYRTNTPSFSEIEEAYKSAIEAFQNAGLTSSTTLQAMQNEFESVCTKHQPTKQGIKLRWNQTRKQKLTTLKIRHRQRFHNKRVPKTGFASAKNECISKDAKPETSTRPRCFVAGRQVTWDDFMTGKALARHKAAEARAMTTYKKAQEEPTYVLECFKPGIMIQKEVMHTPRA